MLEQQKKLWLVCSLLILSVCCIFVLTHKKITNTTMKTSDIQMMKKSEKKIPEQLIADALKNYPRMHYIFPELDKITVSEIEDVLEYQEFIFELNERRPGHYTLYTLTAKDVANTGMFCYINSDDQTVYVQRTYESGIFSAEDYQIIVPPTFTDQGMTKPFDDTMRSLLIKNKAVDSEADLVFTYFPEGNESPVAKLNVIAKMEDGIGKHDVGQYIIDLFERKIIDKSTGNVLYDDSAVMHYPEKEITLNNCGMETIELLKNLKMIDSDEKYYVADTTVSDGHYSLNGREGYFVTIRKDNPKNPEVAEMIGHFFINSTGTVVMKYNATWDYYEYIYGRYTPFG